MVFPGIGPADLNAVAPLGFVSILAVAFGALLGGLDKRLPRRAQPAVLEARAETAARKAA